MDNKIKVLFVNETDQGGGSARAALSLCHDVRRFGANTLMLVQNKKTANDDVISVSDFVPKGLLWGMLDSFTLKIKNKLQHTRWRPYKKTQDKSYKSDTRGRYLFGVFRKLDYDILHLHWINNRFVKVPDLPKGKPIVWTLHDSWPFCGVCHYFLDCVSYQNTCGECPQLGSKDSKDLSYKCWKEKFNAYKNLDLHIVAPSNWLAECARRSSLFSGRDVHVIPNSVDIDTFKPLGNEWRLALPEKIREKRFEKPLVLYGAVNAATDKRKGFANLFSAMQILEKHGNADFELLIFGANKGDIDFNVNIPATFLGFVKDPKEMAALYNLADVMVVPSLTENLSCVIMESLSCGTPVVAFNIGGNSDMVEHKINGYLAKEKDDADLAEGIIWCLQNNADCHLSENARKKVLENFSPDIVGKKYAGLYRKLIKVEKL